MENEEIKDQVIIYSVSPLKEEIISSLLNKLSFLKKAKIINKVNPDLIAGILIKTKNQVIDLSLYNRLLELKKIIYEISD